MRNKNNWIVPFPCLRCGKSTVLVFPLFLLAGETSSTFMCRLCDTHHYLSLTKIADGFSACYCRYTRRYALDGYDVDACPTIIRIDNGRDSKDDSDNEVFSGPINIYPRKRRFSCSEVKNIWQVTSGRCHICGQHWRLDQRGMSGWHIDHVIPHIGGGRDVEKLPNLRIACSICNQKKGRGYKEVCIRLCLRQLISHIASY